MKNIILFKKCKIIDKPIRISDNWFNAGKWADENIKSEHEKYYFQNVNPFKVIFYKIWLKINKNK